MIEYPDPNMPQNVRSYLELISVFIDTEMGLAAEVYRDYSCKYAEPPLRVIMRDIDAGQTVAVKWAQPDLAYQMAKNFAFSWERGERMKFVWRDASVTVWL